MLSLVFIGQTFALPGPAEALCAPFFAGLSAFVIIVLTQGALPQFSYLRQVLTSPSLSTVMIMSSVSVLMIISFT